jgi:hypothetical protein
MKDYKSERKGQTMTRRLSVIVRASIGSRWQSPSTVIASLLLRRKAWQSSISVIARLSVRKAVAISKGKK